MVILPIVEVRKWRGKILLWYKHIFCLWVKVMKKHVVFSCAVILMFIAISVVMSCSNFGIPETVEIKTNAKYGLNMGFDILDMNEYLSPKTMRESFGNNSKLKVYDYNPGGTAPVKHFLIEYPAINQSIDISKHFDNLDFGTEVDDAMSFDESFEVGDVNIHLPLQVPVATNVTDYPITGINMNIESSSNLRTAVIDKGELILAIRRPAGWNNVTASLDSMTLTGGITKNNPTFTDLGGAEYLLHKRLDLMDEIFTAGKGPVTLNGTIKLNTPPNNATASLVVDMRVESYKTVTADIGNVDTRFPFSKPLPAELSNFVKSINCNEVGIAFKYKNNLPSVTGNEVTIKVGSTFLGIPTTSKTLVSDNSVHSEKISDTNKPLYLTNTNDIDITVELTLPNAQKAGNDTLITVNNITAGQTYSLSLTDFQLILDWTAITVDSSKLNQNNKTVDLPIDFNEMFGSMKSGVAGLDNFVDALKFENIPAYMYMVKSSAISGISINNTGTKFNLKSKEDAAGKDLLAAGQNIDFTETTALPELNTEKTVTADFSLIPSMIKLNDSVFSTAINDKHTDLKLGYDIVISNNGTSELTISKIDVDRIKASGGALDVKAAVYIDIPVRLTLNNKADIDLMKMAGMDGGDLMWRNEPLSIGEYEKYMNAVKSMEMIMNMQNSVFFDAPSARINFVVDDKTSGGKNILGEKNYPLSNITIVFTVEETKQILKSAPPYMPAIKINFPAGSGFQLPQSNAKFGFSGKVNVITDGSIIIGESR